MKTAEIKPINIFLTDDDTDDCMLFSEAVQEILGNQEANFTISSDGIKLMEALGEKVPPAPEVNFLDLNMPRKNGFECLDEIGSDIKIKDIPVVIFSTSSNKDIVNRTYQQGANCYVCKPQSYHLLKRTIAFLLSMDSNNLAQKTLQEQFVINLA